MPFSAHEKGLSVVILFFCIPLETSECFHSYNISYLIISFLFFLTLLLVLRISVFPSKRKASSILSLKISQLC